jgi:hypothetical protein
LSDAPQKSIFLALPTMGTYNFGLLNKLSWFGMQDDYRVGIGQCVGTLFHDTARNNLAAQFLESGADYLLFIDADVDPAANILSLASHDKDIIAANVFAWMAGKSKNGDSTTELFSSIWDQAPCEECNAVEQFQKDGSNKDRREYRINPRAPDILERYDPFSHTWKLFYDREAREYMAECRCQGTGKDPYVYNPSPKITHKESPIEVDAVGAAATMIARRVIEKMPPPWFQFVYRHMRDVMTTEDLYFCYKAKQLGFTIWADQYMPARHFKETDLLQVNSWGGRLIDKTAKMLEQKKAEKPRIIIPGVPDMVGHFR